MIILLILKFITVIKGIKDIMKKSNLSQSLIMWTASVNLFWMILCVIYINSYSKFAIINDLVIFIIMSLGGIVLVRNLRINKIMKINYVYLYSLCMLLDGITQSLYALLAMITTNPFGIMCGCLGVILSFSILVCGIFLNVISYQE